MWRYGKTLFLGSSVFATVLACNLENKTDVGQKLPSSLRQLQQSLENTTNPDEAKHIRQYSLPSLVNGRPLNKVVIMMAGEKGTGKSLTIKRLFEDSCKTAESQSETADVLEYSKRLRVTNVQPEITADLTFVDVPGSVDNESNRESTKLTQLLNYRTFSPALRERPSQELRALSGVNGRNKVYPNLALLVVNSSNRRMQGPDASLKKSLEFLKKCKVVDKKNRNLIVVATHACSLGTLKTKFEEKSNRITSVIQTAVEDVLTISSVPVIFVENDPEAFNLEKGPDSDFYKLPDGTLSHANLILAIFDNFNRSKDKLGLLLTSWYFRSDCPDKGAELLTEKVNSYVDLSEVEKASKKILQNFPNSDFEVVPTHHWHSIGQAYCPVSETPKSQYVFQTDDDKLRNLRIGNSTFQIPEFVKYNKDIKTNFVRLCHESKEEYEKHKKAQYGMDWNMELIVQVAPRGKWTQIAQSYAGNEEISMSVLHELRQASLHIENPGNSKFISEELVNALRDLPQTYNNDDDAESFNRFFSKWGTHFICKQYFGGSIKFDYATKISFATQQSLSALETRIEGILMNLGKLNFYSASAVREQELTGISHERITISGGDPPMVSSMKEISPEIFQKWKKSVETDPRELEHIFMLYPYYNLAQCQKSNSDALRKATLDYLSLKLKSASATKRDEIAESGFIDAITRIPCIIGDWLGLFR